MTRLLFFAFCLSAAVREWIKTKWPFQSVEAP
jgi:hypothetical protein